MKKTTQHTVKLLTALVAGLGLSATAAYADDDSHYSTASACSQKIVTACGLTLVKQTCTGATRTGYTDDHDENRLDRDGRNESDDFHYGKTDSDGKTDDKDRVSRDHSDRRGKTFTDGSDASKVYVCHRMGGASVTLSVDNDGYLHGHSKHLMDTIGPCSDFDGRDRTHDDDDSKGFSAHDAEIAHQAFITPNVVSCLNATAGTTVSLKTANGTTWTGPAPGCNVAGVTCTIAATGGGSGSTSGSMPSRGSVRSVR